MMNALLEEIYATGVVKTDDGEALQVLPVGVPQALADTLYRIIRENNAQRTLEVGMAYGLSSLSICQALRDNGSGQHTIIDPRQSSEWKSIGMRNLHKANLADQVEFYEQPAHLALPDLLRQGRTFDFVFIDGMHLFDYFLLDFFYALRLTSVGGFIAIDDINFPAINSALAFILRNLSRLVTVVELDQRLGVLKKVSDDDDRTSTYTGHFRPFEVSLGSLYTRG
ncbi:MAG TPA: class I SAM-dependent methyltransferase [Ktedonobacteraceae bacterium]|jgi:predicted O-methyltransferase YrrM